MKKNSNACFLTLFQGVSETALVISFSVLSCHWRFFEMHKNGNNANIGIRGLISGKQRMQLQNATIVSIEPLDL